MTLSKPARITLKLAFIALVVIILWHAQYNRPENVVHRYFMELEKGGDPSPPPLLGK